MERESGTRGGFIANDDARYRVEIKVDEGYHLLNLNMYVQIMTF